MEKKLEEIRKFLSVSDGDGDGSGYGDGDGYGYGSGSGYGDGSGDGDGDGSGYGDGYGDGDGSGYGDGDGSGSGSGSGSGDGSGDGSGIPEFDGRKVYQIDGVPTLIDSVHGNYAKGSILNGDFTLTPCYISRVENCFAHGTTLAQALKDARSKAMERMPLEERIAKFREQYPDPDKLVPARELYDLHHVLTGSCEMGRSQFARDHGIDIDKDAITIREFVVLTRHAYGSEAIRKLAEAYGIPTSCC